MNHRTQTTTTPTTSAYAAVCEDTHSGDSESGEHHDDEFASRRLPLHAPRCDPRYSKPKEPQGTWGGAVRGDLSDTRCEVVTVAHMRDGWGHEAMALDEGKICVILSANLPVGSVHRLFGSKI